MTVGLRESNRSLSSPLDSSPPFQESSRWTAHCPRMSLCIRNVISLIKRLQPIASVAQPQSFCGALDDIRGNVVAEIQSQASRRLRSADRDTPGRFNRDIPCRTAFSPAGCRMRMDQTLTRVRRDLEVHHPPVLNRILSISNRSQGFRSPA